MTKDEIELVQTIMALETTIIESFTPIGAMSPRIGYYNVDLSRDLKNAVETAKDSIKVKLVDLKDKFYSIMVDDDN